MFFNVRIRKALVLFVIFLVWAEIVFSEPGIVECKNFISKADNYKTAHQNSFCINAAKNGSSYAQYSVGMGYGFSGNHELEEHFYRLAAKQGSVAAYLALGHLVRSKDFHEAITWYEKYYESKHSAYGYAALLIAKIYAEQGESELFDSWLLKCQESTYAENCMAN